jgi:hypothetical protein
MGGPSSGRVTAIVVAQEGMRDCREEGCERQVSPLSTVRLCNTHHKRWARWNLGKPPRLPEHVLERETFPYRDWCYSIWAKTNTVHCMSRVLLVEGDEGWVAVALCNTTARLRPAGALAGWSTEAARCGRCEGILRRVGLIE